MNGNGPRRGRRGILKARENARRALPPMRMELLRQGLEVSTTP
jgi:hypothetical protein